jgi:uncharacterized RDD family membrane protein YckC
VTTLVVDTSEGVTLRFEIAGAGSRLAAGLLDLVMLGSGYLALGIALMLAMSLDPSGASGFFVGLYAAGGLLIAILYHFLFHALRRGQTPGKSALGIRVMSSDGYPPRTFALLIRALVWPIDVFLIVPLPLGLIVITATPKHQRLGDLAAGTLLIRAPREAAPSEPWPDEAWSTLAVRTLPLMPGLSARLSARDLEFLRRLITRTDLDPEERRKLFVEAARHYSSLLDLGPFEDARVVLKELYLFARETSRTRAA